MKVELYFKRSRTLVSISEPFLQIYFIEKSLYKQLALYKAYSLTDAPFIALNLVSSVKDVKSSLGHYVPYFNFLSFSAG